MSREDGISLTVDIIALQPDNLPAYDEKIRNLRNIPYEFIVFEHGEEFFQVCADHDDVIPSTEYPFPQSSYLLT